jgi:phosphatidylinositol glycan class A protein
MIEFARPDADGQCTCQNSEQPTDVSCTDIINALGRAIGIIRSGRHDPFTAHERLKGMYSWAAIAERTERVYDRILQAEDRPLFERMAR